MEKPNSIGFRFIKVKKGKMGKDQIVMLKSIRINDKAEKLLDEMLKFLAEMPVDSYHDYRIFRHSGLRGYLINRFLRERMNIFKDC